MSYDSEKYLSMRVLDFSTTKGQRSKQSSCPRRTLLNIIAGRPHIIDTAIPSHVETIISYPWHLYLRFESIDLIQDINIKQIQQSTPLDNMSVAATQAMAM